jgi:hypothetical protein
MGAEEAPATGLLEIKAQRSEAEQPAPTGKQALAMQELIKREDSKKKPTP